MALTGELSDLSLAELIEFFCNQRKTGRLKVVYPKGPGYFYLQSGAVVHARVGELRGIEAVYFALTQPNASFTFSPAFDAPEQTIHQPWASLVLEGLRRMDEGISPRNAFVQQSSEPVPEEKANEKTRAIAAEAPPKPEVPVLESKHADAPVLARKQAETFVPAFASELPRSNPWTLRAVFASLVLIIAVIGIPWGWYARNKAAKLAKESKPLAVENTLPAPAANQVATESVDNPTVSTESESPATNSEAADLAAKRQREARARERAKLQESAGSSLAEQPPAKEPSSVASQNAARNQSSTTNAGSKRVTVQVTYDENGRVTQASGADPTALRIARQKRFPAGKAGSATITIPIN